MSHPPSRIPKLCVYIGCSVLIDALPCGLLPSPLQNCQSLQKEKKMGREEKTNNNSRRSYGSGRRRIKIRREREEASERASGRATKKDIFSERIVRWANYSAVRVTRRLRWRRRTISPIGSRSCSRKKQDVPRPRLARSSRFPAWNERPRMPYLLSAKLGIGRRRGRAETPDRSLHKRVSRASERERERKVFKSPTLSLLLSKTLRISDDWRKKKPRTWWLNYRAARSPNGILYGSSLSLPFLFFRSPVRSFALSTNNSFGCKARPRKRNYRRPASRGIIRARAAPDFLAPSIIHSNALPLFISLSLAAPRGSMARCVLDVVSFSPRRAH